MNCDFDFHLECFKMIYHPSGNWVKKKASAGIRSLRGPSPPLPLSPLLPSPFPFHSFPFFPFSSLLFPSRFSPVPLPASANPARGRTAGAAVQTHFWNILSLGLANASGDNDFGSYFTSPYPSENDNVRVKYPVTHSHKNQSNMPSAV